MKQLIGRVISAKMTKTVVVKVKRQKIDPLYRKRINLTKKYHADDPIGVKEGDEVKFAEIRPVSKTKKWKIVEVIKQ